MKLKAIMIAGAMIMFTAMSVSAQLRNDAHVKILRTPEAGVIKLLYGLHSQEPLHIQFSTRSGIVGSDKIKGTYPKGFMKKYDVRQIIENEFWVEIASSNMTTIYRIVPSRDRKSFVSHLERADYRQDFVAQK
jgi:hypothetical protein